MRILHIVATDKEWGGLERSVVDLAAIQTADPRLTVRVLGAPIVLERLPSQVERRELAAGRSRHDPRLLWSLAGQMRAFRPDVVHAHANKAAALVNAVRWCTPRCATVATVQNTKRSVGMFARFDEVIAVSRKAGASLGAIPHQVVWNAIPRIAAPSAPGNTSDLPFLGRGKPVIAAVGRLVPAKGFGFLLQALRSVDAHLWIIGDGKLRSELETLAAELGVAERVWFAGFRQDVSRLMCLADLMVISSRNEGFPFALVEMLHLRRPVVGTRVAGVEEILPASYLCEIGQPDALADTINRALARGAAGRAHDFTDVFDFAAQELALENTSRRITEIYRSALRKRGLPA